MAEWDIGSATASDLTNVQTDFSVPSETTDAASESGETRYTNKRFNEYLGYYDNISDLRNVIDVLAKWTVGKGYEADEITTLILDNIRGFGADTFNEILMNMVRTMHIGGDSFAEIITNKEGFLINLKPLDPSVIVIVADTKGIILRYEQTSKIKGQANKKFDKDDIWHLARNRVADEIHGKSFIKPLIDIVLKKEEAESDMKTLMHRHVKPMRVFHLATDNQAEIDALKTKYDNATEGGENMFLPKDMVETEIQAIAPNATLNPLPWMQYLEAKFYKSAGVPEIVVGGTGAITDAGVKTAYLAYEETIHVLQLFVTDQGLAQFNLVFKLIFPASLAQGVLSGKQNEDGVGVNPPQAEPQQPAGEPNDTILEQEGRK